MAVRVMLIGMAAVALLETIRVVRLRRLAAKGAPASHTLSAEVGRVAAALGVKPPTVRVLPDIASPFVCGLGRPLLLWPAALCDSLSSHCQRGVIVHELAHLRRRDHWVAWLRARAGCVWWWDPRFWIVSP